MKIEYYNLYTHFVFTTHHRAPVILESARERIEKYITGDRKKPRFKNVRHLRKSRSYAFPCSRSPMISEYLLATTLSRSSEEFIRKNDLIEGNFQWQNTCSAFSVSKSGVDIVCKYILNQPQHHKTVSFADEYNAMLKHYQTGSRWNYLK